MNFMINLVVYIFVFTGVAYIINGIASNMSEDWAKGNRSPVAQFVVMVVLTNVIANMLVNYFF